MTFETEAGMEHALETFETSISAHGLEVPGLEREHAGLKMW